MVFCYIAQVKQHGKRRVLGLLDIYGFENLTTNSFEQLIINYCNEKLHHHVTDALLKEEQEEYVYEGLEWNPIPYVDNSAVCDIIDKVHLEFKAKIKSVKCQKIKIKNSFCG